MPSASCQHGPDCPEDVIRSDFPITPEMLEINDVYSTQGPDAATVRMNQLDRNRHRRQLRSEHKRYAALALDRNMRIAAKKLAAAQQPQPETPTRKSPASDWDAFENEEKEAKSTA